MDVEVPGPDLAELGAGDGAAGRGGPAGEMTHLVVLQADVEGGQIVFGELVDGDAAGPGPDVGFGQAG